MSKSKKTTNLARHEKLKNYLKLFKFKKKILNKSKILANLILVININIIEYPIIKARIVFIQLRKKIIKISIFLYFDLECCI